MDNNNSLKIGQELYGFKVHSIDIIPKIKQHLYHLKHKSSGASLIHLSNDDNNNTFGVAFVTCPNDSTGVAHILEHLVLCGSKKFPTKDPFFSMLRRSLATFMNALTASDWTLYPFSSQNKKDFYNLMDVYSDAVFFPLLKKESFEQEAHRLEKNKNKIVAQGVVFNEMKGAMSSPTEIMYRRTLQSIFPTITYHHNSGGEPLDILDLSLAQLRKFHKTNYSPSRAKFFSYGNFPLSKTLAFLQNNTFKKWESLKRDEVKISKEKRYKTAQNFKYFYPLANNEDHKKAYQITLNWLTCPITNSLEVLSLSLLNEILLGSLAAPLRFKLIESNYGKDLADTVGYHAEYSETFFSVGLKGVESSKVSKVDKLIRSSLKEIVEQGINTSFIESAIHQKELEIREISESRYPYSLNLLFRFIGSWINQGNIIESLDFDSQIEKIKKKITKEKYFEGLIQKYLIDNPHRVKIILAPDKSYLAKQESKIEKKIKLTAKKLIQQQKNIPLAENNRPIKTEKLDCLPSLSLKDIELGLSKITSTKKQGITQYNQITNGLEYWNIYLQNPKLDLMANQDISLICGMLTEIGTKNFNYEEFSAQINRYTGGIGLSFLCCPNFNQQNYHQLICISAKSLNSNKKKMQQLIQELLVAYDFSNHKRIKQWIEQITIDKINSIVHQGHLYAETLACRNFSKILELEEQQGGIHFIKRLKELNKIKKFDNLSKQYQKNWNEFLNNSSLSLFTVGDEINYNLLKSFTKDTNIPLTSSWSNSPNELKNSKTLKEIWTSATAVSFVARCYPTIDFKHPDNPKLFVLAKLLMFNYIHQEIREKGGAYGGIANFHRDSGIFSFLSYRDPNLWNSWEVYRKAIDWVIDGSFTQKQVENSILQCFATLDKPLTPQGNAAKDFFDKQIGQSFAFRLKYRKQLLAVTKKDLISVAEKWLTKNNYCDVAISNKESIKKNKTLVKDYQIYSI